jgi:hypothetical protein
MGTVNSIQNALFRLHQLGRAVQLLGVGGRVSEERTMDETELQAGV